MNIDLTGRRFGRLIAIEPTEYRYNKCIVWFCRCDCGNHVLVSSSRLTHNLVMDCGCLCGKPVQAVLDDYVKNYRGGWKNKKWKEQVKKQNGSICQKCGNDKNLIIHHIYSYKENWDRRHDVNNGVVLCQECHKKFHKSFGYRNNTEEQLVEFLSNL